MMLIRKTTGRRMASPITARSDKRYENPTLLISLDGRCVYTIDWSFGGIKISGVHAAFPLGREVEGQFIGRVDEDDETEIHFIAKVIRCDATQNATRLRFVMLSDVAFDAMESALVRRNPALT